jgi:15,16-dihydrobiliverdin:ferredoxin oxidoreductase
MDLEEPFLSSKSKHQELLKRYNVPLPPSSSKLLQIPKHGPDISVEEVHQRYGMPWKSSIDPTYPHDSLFYMDFWEWQIQFMKDNLTNLRVLATESKSGEDLTYQESKSGKQPIRMITLCFASDEYRKIRMTVYDAGNRTQVFTSLWYPQPEYNLPVLGTDLLQFNNDRHLCVVDFQPIQNSEEEHAQRYEHLLKPIRDQYPSLQGQMSKRFYDENHFFSKQMLYSRFDDDVKDEKKQESQHLLVSEDDKHNHPVYRDLMPAYQQYVQTHLKLIHTTQPRADHIPKVLRGQAAYDTYSADRDPAHAMFTKVFGSRFADDFVYDVLFSYSEGNHRSAAK